MTTRMALRGDKLDLGVWHGFQELFVDHEFVPPFEVAWVYDLPKEGSYLSFLFGPDKKRLNGLRVSRDQRFPSMTFKALEQQFVQKKALPAQTILPQGKIRCLFEPELIHCYCNDVKIGQWEGEGDVSLRLGFRGGHEHASLDDLIVKHPDGRILFQEDFRYKVSLGERSWALLLFGGIFFLIQLGFFWLFWRRKNASVVFFSQLTLGLFLALCLAVFLMLLPYFKDLYPRVGKRIKQNERRWANARAQEVDAIVKQRHAIGKIGKRVLLMLGSSQTWGAGADKEEHVISHRLEKRLGEKYFLVLNGGISSCDSEQIMEIYFSQWISLDPFGVIINLGTNDHDPEALYANVRKIAERNHLKGIRTILILEPNLFSPGWGGLKRNHDALINLSEKLKIPAIDMQRFLQTHYDDGFLWYDDVHLTSFGQKLFAEELYDQIKPLLNLESTVTPGRFPDNETSSVD